MSVIHVTQQIESDTLHLPELRSLIGKKVEITIREVATPTAAGNPWEALQELAGKDLIDPEAYKELRRLEVDHWRPGTQ